MSGNDPATEYEQPASPFESTPKETGKPTAEPEGKTFDWWGLRNSSPHVTPSEIGYQLDLTAKWYEHLFCGFLKQSNSDAAEAWQHYVIALVLLADQEVGLLSSEDREQLEKQAEEWDELENDER